METSIPISFGRVLRDSIVVWINVMTAPQYLTLYAGDSVWQVRAAADMNGDGRSDLVWQSPTGRVVVWFLNGLMFIGGTEPGRQHRCGRSVPPVI